MTNYENTFRIKPKKLQNDKIVSVKMLLINCSPIHIIF